MDIFYTFSESYVFTEKRKRRKKLCTVLHKWRFNSIAVIVFYISNIENESDWGFISNQFCITLQLNSLHLVILSIWILIQTLIFAKKNRFVMHKYYLTKKTCQIENLAQLELNATCKNLLVYNKKIKLHGICPSQLS